MRCGLQQLHLPSSPQFRLAKVRFEALRHFLIRFIAQYSLYSVFSDHSAMHQSHVESLFLRGFRDLCERHLHLFGDLLPFGCRRRHDPQKLVLPPAFSCHRERSISTIKVDHANRTDLLSVSWRNGKVSARLLIITFFRSAVPLSYSSSLT